jgi:two-component system, sensor histidine kinase LadS
MKGKGFWVFAIVFLFMVLFLEKEVQGAVSIQQDKEKYPIYKSMEILEDPEGVLSIEDVSSPSYSNQFKKNDGGIPSYGYNSSVYWVRFEIDNRIATENFILEFPYAPHDSIMLFEPDRTSGYKVSYGGDLLPFDTRDRNHRHVTYNLQLHEKESHTYYVRFESEGSLQLSVILWEESAFAEKSLIEYLFLGLYFGAALAMVIYNLFLSLSLRVSTYIWYVIFIIGISLTQLTLNGIAYQFIWPESPWWNNRSIVFSLAITNAASAIFVSKFLEARHYAQRWCTLLHFIAIFNLVIMIVLMLNYTLALYLVMISTVLLIFLVFTTTVLCWKRGNVAARYLFLGWFVFLISGLVTSLSDAGMLSVNAFTSYAPLIGSVIEMLLFSLALADKVKLLQKEKEKAEKKALVNMEKVLEKSQSLNKLNNELEERVKTRTRELEISTEKLLGMEMSRRHLLSNISHDIGTPMTAIQGYIKAMIDGVIDPGSPYYLEILYDKTLYVDRLIQDLHDLSRLETGQASFYKISIPIHDFINKIVNGFERDVTKNNIKFTVNNYVSVKENSLTLCIDPDRIRQVLENLISNAIKYTKGQGSITIDVMICDDFFAFHNEKQKYIKEIAVALEEQLKSHKGSNLVIRVHDNGKGIDAKSLPFIFDRYYRGDTENYESYQNAGLGLAIAKEVIDHHDGIIWAESMETKGSSFYFTLPIYLGEKEKEGE